MNKPKPSLEQLQHLCPFDRFSEQQMVLVVAKSILKEYAADDVVMEIGNHDKLEYFLIEGTIALESFDGRFKEVSAGTESARTAIALLQPRKYTIKTKTPCVFVLIQQVTVNTLLEELPKDKSTEFCVSDLHSGHEITDIAQNFEADLQSNNLTIPSFPDVALRIKQLLDDPNVTVKDVADVLNNDPAITVKLLKTCNSPLYRTANEITSNRDAIVRLGFNTTRQLITIFALKEIFKSKNKLLQQKMGELWAHSSEVASISYILASKTPGMNPEQAMLAGLMQDIGAIPILNYIENYPDFMKLDYKVDAIINSSKSRIGAKILEHWGFSADLMEVAKNSDNWSFQSPHDKPSYVDITIVANIHSFIGKKTHPKYPPFDQIPAFKKIGKNGLTPEESQDVLHEAQHQLDDLKALLCPKEIPVLH
jgi:HD-like signal output (HDOD) protein